MASINVKDLRRRLGLSQAGFAAMLGVTANTVARWERGELGMRSTTQRLIELIASRPKRKQRKRRV